MQVPNQQFANTISPMTSPMFNYSPILASPNFQLQQHPFPHPTSPALPTPADWTWTGITTPQHLQTQPQPPDWSIVADKGASPVEMNRRPSRMSMLAAISPSATRKRAHDVDDAVSNDLDQERTNELPNTKKQIPSPTPPVPTVSKRPPFPFAIPKALSKTTQPAIHSRTASSNLNPFATEFVFRPPQSAPTLESVRKEFSPVHLQQSSKSLFNVFAPEFNPSTKFSGSNGLSINNATMFSRAAKQSESSLFVKPSPTKKVIPIVPPVDDDSDTELDDNYPIAKRSRDEAQSSLEATTSDDISGSDPFQKQSVEPVEEEEFATPESISREASEVDLTDDLNANASPQKSSSANGTRPRINGNDDNAESSSEEVSENDDKGIAQTLTNRSVAQPVNGEVKHPMSREAPALDLKSSPEIEFNGYPSFWEQRLLKSEQKAKRDRKLTPRGTVARNLANELLDQEEESDDISDDKENRIMPDPDDYSSDATEESVLGNMKKTGRIDFSAQRDSATRVEIIVKERLQPVLKGLEAVQIGLQRLSGRDKEERRKEQGSDADDEDDEVTFRKPGTLWIEKIKSAVSEAMRQEKEQHATPPVVPDRTAELMSIIDSLKSKLLDAEDNLNREERRRTEAERRNELLSRDLTQYESTIESKTDQLKTYEFEIKELQKNHDHATRGWDNERHTSEQLEDVISGIRNSLGQMTDKNSKLSQEISTLQSLSSQQKDDISSLREEISKARGENGKLARERNKLVREIDDERARFTNLQNELMETGKAIAEQETRWREELSAEKLRVQSLERNLVDEERRVKKMEEECEKLGKIAEERGRLKAMVEASVARERSLEAIKEKLEKRVYAAEAREGVAQEDRARREKERSVQFEREKDQLKAEISSLQVNLKTLQEERTKASIIYGRERTDLAVQSEKIESLGRELKQAMQSNLDREKLLESSNRELKESQSSNMSLRKEVAGLREKLDEKEAQVESLRERLDISRASIVEKDKNILELEFIIASTTSPTKKSRDDESYVKLQKREKEILRLRESMAALLSDNEALIAQSTEIVLPEQQKKYNAMKNVLRAERERRKALERELARALAKSKDDMSRTSVSRNGGPSIFETPASAMGGLDTPVSLNDTPGSLRGFSVGEDTPLKGKGVFIES